MSEATAGTLTLDNEVFSPFVESFNKSLTLLIDKMRGMGIDEGEITAKMAVEFGKTTVPDPCALDLNRQREATVPTIKHKVSTVLKITNETKGMIPAEYELVCEADTGNLRLRKITDGQTSLFDDAGDEDF